MTDEEKRIFHLHHACSRHCLLSAIAGDVQLGPGSLALLSKLMELRDIAVERRHSASLSELASAWSAEAIKRKLRLATLYKLSLIHI